MSACSGTDLARTSRACLHELDEPGTRARLKYPEALFDVPFPAEDPGRSLDDDGPGSHRQPVGAGGEWGDACLEHGAVSRSWPLP